MAPVEVFQDKVALLPGAGQEGAPTAGAAGTQSGMEKVAVALCKEPFHVLT